jgi:hypothetical protein
MFIPLFLSQLAAADCSIPIPQSMFNTKLADVEEALRDRDSALMTQKMEQLTESIPCLAQPVTQVQASRYHTLQGISQFLKKDTDKAQLYFSSARAANSQALISTDFYPEGHMIHNLFTTAPEVSDGDNLEPPAKGSLLFDGLNSSNRPLYRPTIYQHIQNGKSISSALLEPLQEMPDYITEQEASAQTSSNSEQKSKGKESTSDASTNEGSASTDSTDSKKNGNSDKNNKKTIGKALLVTGLVATSFLALDQFTLAMHLQDNDKRPPILVDLDSTTKSGEDIKQMYYASLGFGIALTSTGGFLMYSSNK